MAAMMSTTTAPRHGARCLGPVMPIVMAEMIPEAGGRRPDEPWATSRNGKANLIPFLGTAHEGGKFAIEARGRLEERRVANAMVDRKLGAGDHLRRVFSGDQVRVLVLHTAPTSGVPGLLGMKRQRELP